MNFDFKKLLPHIAALVVFAVSASIYFYPQFSGKKVSQSDIVQFKGMASEVIEYKDKGETILWTNSMFAGMPTYQISAPAKKNVSRLYEKSLGLWFKRPAAYFLVGMVAFYIALLMCNVNSWIALIGSLVFAFGTNNMVLFEAGHTSKIRVLMVSVLIVAGIIQVMRKQYVVGSLAYGIGMAVSLFGNHFQMTYYLGIVMGIYVILKAIELIRKGEINHLLKSAGLLFVMSLVAIGTSASKVWTTYEYQKTTMRGKPILKKASNVQQNSSSSTEGLAWDYAMQWSNGFIDVMAMYIPGVAGGGSGEQLSKKSATNKFLRKTNRHIPRGPMYHGPLPFTSGPQYVGAITILLFIISLFVVNSTMRYWAISAFVLTVIMSMGKNLELINTLLYDYLPMLNKFRSPASITSVTAIFTAFVAFFGMNKLLKEDYIEKNREYLKKVVLGVTLSLGAICLFYAIIGPAVIDFETPGDAKYARDPGLVDAFMKDRASLMRSDAIRTLIFTLLVGGALWAVVMGKLKKVVAVAVIGVLLLIDLWGVDMRYLNHDSFQRKRVVENQLNPRPVDNQINNDTDIHFRVHDVSSGSPYLNSRASLHNKALGGYHAAKLQRYQDLIDTYLSKGNSNAMNMLNTKYVITGTPGQEKAQRNPDALGNAWFVSEVKQANTANEEFDFIGTINPKTTAAIHKDFNIPSANFSNAGSINLSSYHPDRLVYQTNNSAEGIAVFSEVWYGGQGWKAYIDGKETDILRANYVLRALKIPAGKHEVVFEFKPKAYYVGENISLISGIVLLGLTIVALYMGLKPKEKVEE